MTSATTAETADTATTTETAGGALAELVAALELAEGTRLARTGRYAEADAALSVTRTTPVGLDLRARIAAQQGRYDEAAGLWHTAAERLGSPDTFAAELAAVTRLQDRPFGRPLRAVALLALGAGIGLAGWTVAERSSSSDDAVERLGDDALDVLDQQADDRRAAEEALAEQLGEPEPGSSAPAGSPAPGATLDSLEARLGAVPGVETTRERDGLQLRFVEPVFGDGTVPTPGGLTGLAGVADALAPDAGRQIVVVTGHTDSLPLQPGSRYDDNEDLALARAQAAVDGLVGAGLPAGAVTVRVTAAPPPYPEAGAAGEPIGGAAETRNRTITLTVYERTAPAAAG